MCKNANLVPIAPRRTKFNSAPEKDVFNDEVMEQFKSGNAGKKAEILQSFNIVQIESPKTTSKSKIVEVDLLSDSAFLAVSSLQSQPSNSRPCL